MLLTTIRSFSIWMAVTFLFCMAIGLMQMFSREVTIDSVRSIDFQLLTQAAKNADLQGEEGKSEYLKLLGVLTRADGRAFFPVAVVEQEGCAENGSIPNLCERFKNKSEVDQSMAASKTIESYGNTILRTDDNGFFFVSMVDNGRSWLVGDAGQYLAFSYNSLKREAHFLKSSSKYITEPSGRSKLWSKNRWIWLFSFMFSLSLWVAVFQFKRQMKKRIDAAYAIRNESENIISDKNNQLLALKIEKEQLSEMLILEDSADDLELAKQRLMDTERQLSQVEDDFLAALLEKDRQEDQISKLIRKVSNSERLNEFDDLSRNLNTLKRLWLTELNWLERYDTEYKIATSNPRRTPFTLFVAFTGWERYLKTMCKKNRIDADGNMTRINELVSNRKISQSQGNFLHEVRSSRNDWLHEGKYPSDKLVTRLLDFLENKQTQPRI